MRHLALNILKQVVPAVALMLLVQNCPPLTAAQPSPSGTGSTTWTLFFYDNADSEYAGDPDASDSSSVLAWRVANGTITLINRVNFDAYEDLGLTHGGKVAGGIFSTP